MADLRRRGRRLAALALTVAVGTGLGGAACPARVSAGPIRPRIGVPALFAMPDRPVCDTDVGAVPTNEGTVDDEGLIEVSGLAASLHNPGVVWMVADSGNDAVVSGVDTATGAVLLNVRLPQPLVDAEDLAVGPCPDLSGSCVFVADTGDNDLDRDDVAVIAFPEPTLSAPQSRPTVPEVQLDAVWTLRYVYPDNEAINVEAVAVLPNATAILFFEKTTNDTARVFAARSPWTFQTPLDDDADNDRPRVLEQTGTVTLPVDPDLPAVDVDDDDAVDVAEKAKRITGAAIHWSGKRLLLRTTAVIVEFADDEAGSGFFDLDGHAPRLVRTAPMDEEQGEAITWTEDGRQWLTISEVKGKAATAGERPVLHRLNCGVTP